MHPRALSIQDYTYELPTERIAAHPLSERTASRLLRYAEGRITDHVFAELPGLLPSGALLVLNDTRVVHARLEFRRSTGARLEFMLLNPGDDRPVEEALAGTGNSQWWCMVGNAKRWKGEPLSLHSGDLELRAERCDQRNGEHLIRFSWTGGRSFADVLELCGHLPLPPYMRREAMPEDEIRYNTVFGERLGSVAAPTASLHFSDGLLKDIEQRGIRHVRLTLHVGAGTFLPVTSRTMAGHHMHSEQVRIGRAALVRILQHMGGGPIIPVGTTALRTLESLYWHGVKVIAGEAPVELAIDQWEPYEGLASSLPSTRAALEAVLGSMRDRDEVTGTTRLLIAPGYTFRLAHGLITNFHQPQSTLLLLVAALLGDDWRRVYAHALKGNYRFLSYGDGSLLLRPRDQ